SCTCAARAATPGARWGCSSASAARAAARSPPSLPTTGTPSPRSWTRPSPRAPQATATTPTATTLTTTRAHPLETPTEIAASAPVTQNPAAAADHDARSQLAAHPRSSPGSERPPSAPRPPAEPAAPATAGAAAPPCSASERRPQGLPHPRVTPLVACVEELAGHRALSPEHDLCALAEGRAERPVRHARPARSAQDLPQGDRELLVGDRLRRGEVHGARDRRIVQAAQHDSDHVLAVDPGEVLGPRPEGPAHEEPIGPRHERQRAPVPIDHDAEARAHDPRPVPLRRPRRVLPIHTQTRQEIVARGRVLGEGHVVVARSVVADPRRADEHPRGGGRLLHRLHEQLRGADAAL